MTEVLQANIFFLITGIAVIIFSVLLCIALFHIIKVIKTIRKITDRIERGTELIVEDMQNVRMYFTGDGLIRKIMSKLINSSSGVEENEDEPKSKRSKKGAQD